MILVKVNGYDLHAKALRALTSGTVGREVRFEFSPEWDDLVKTAVFRGSGEARDVALLTDTSCTLPLDVMTAQGGDLEIGVYGRNTEGTIVMPTVWGRIEYIREGAALSEVDPSDPEPSWSAQVQAAAAEALEKAEAVEAAAARGDFDGDTGPQGGTGPQGPPGVSPAVAIEEIAGGHSVTITDADHPAGQSFDVLDGNYTKPSGGIPKDDLASGVQTSLGKADTALQEHQSLAAYRTSADQDLIDAGFGTYSKPSGGIPSSDLASGVQTSLGKADTAYQKPSGGIPSSDLASGVQTSLGKADTAYQKPSGGIPASDLASGVIPTVPSAYTSNPAMDGTASAGSSAAWARGDHVHPTDTSRAAKALGITGAAAGDFVTVSAVSGGVPTAFTKKTLPVSFSTLEIAGNSSETVALPNSTRGVVIIPGTMTDSKDIILFVSSNNGNVTYASLNNAANIVCTTAKNALTIANNGQYGFTCLFLIYTT